MHLPVFQEAWPRLTTSGEEFNLEALLPLIAGQEPLFKAGNGWAYSDTGYVLLGLVEAALADLAIEAIR